MISVCNGQVTRHETTNYPFVPALRNKSSEETVAAWKDMYLGVSKFVPSARTIGAHLMGIFMNTW